MNVPLRDFYFIRHGQTDWNLHNRCMGQQDIPLNANGIHEIELAKELLRKTPIKTICHSPLKRAKQSAEIIQSVIPGELIEIDDLKECTWGNFEGQDKGDRSYFSLWLQGEALEGAERYPDFLDRALRGVQQSLEYPMPLIVAHGGVYWAILRELQQLETFTSAIPNGIPVYHQAPKAQHERWDITYLDDLFHIEPFEE